MTLSGKGNPSQGAFFKLLSQRVPNLQYLTVEEYTVNDHHLFPPYEQNCGTVFSYSQLAKNWPQLRFIDVDEVVGRRDSFCYVSCRFTNLRFDKYESQS